MFFTALNRLVRDFEGTPNSGISVRPPSGLVFVVPGAVASSFFRASRSTIPISNLALYEHQTPVLSHSPRVARGAPPSRSVGLAKTCLWGRFVRVYKTPAGILRNSTLPEGHKTGGSADCSIDISRPSTSSAHLEISAERAEPAPFDGAQLH